MGAIAFISRDFIQYILPSIIAIGLFAPLFVENVSTEGVIFSGALLGYLVTSPISSFQRKILLVTPHFRQKIKEAWQRHDWWSANYDFSRFWYALSNDDREYLYLTQSYAEFYRIIAFYMMIYLIANLTILTVSLYSGLDGKSIWHVVWSTNTPVVGGISIPSVVVVLISAVIWYFALRDYLVELKILFDDHGQYVNLARRYHEKDGSIAKSVWGWVRCGNDAVQWATVRMSTVDGSIIDEVRCDAMGRFQFRDFVEKHTSGYYRISVDSCCLKKQIVIRIGGNAVPEFNIY